MIESGFVSLMDEENPKMLAQIFKDKDFGGGGGSGKENTWGYLNQKMFLHDMYSI